MEILVGRPVSPGYAQGTAVLFNTDDNLEIPNRKIHLTEVEDELGRFERAVARSSAELQELEQRVTSELGYSHSSIFSAHLALVHDKGFVERVSGRIRRDLMNAEQAVDVTVGELAASIRALDNPYLQERARDVRDIGRRLITQLVYAGARQAVDFAGEFSIMHPSVLRAIWSVVKACNSAGRELSVCGEAAGDPLTASLLVGLGVRHLSMSPGRAARVRLAIRHHRCDELQRVAEEALSASTTERVRQLLFAALGIADKQPTDVDRALFPIRKTAFAGQHVRL